MDLVPVSPNLLIRCIDAAGLLQNGFASVLGVNPRTLSRWLDAGTTLSSAQCHAAARAVFRKDPALAAELATMGGTTLQALGLVVAPPAQAAVAVAPAPQSRPFGPGSTAAVLDSVVCAGADLHGYPTGHVRQILAASGARALELGLTMQALVQGLAAAAAGAKKNG